MEIRYQRNFTDYQEVFAAQKKKTLRLKIIVSLSLCIFWVLGIIVLASLGLTQGQGTVAMLAGTLILVKAASFAQDRWLKRDFCLHPGFAQPESARIDDSGLYLESEGGSSQTKWTAFVKYQETRNLVLLYLGARSAHVLPKRAFSAHQLEEFRQLVRVKIRSEALTSLQRSTCVQSPS